MICKHLKGSKTFIFRNVRVLVFLLPCDLRPQRDNQSLTGNTENERIDMFIYDDEVGREMGGAY
jgi:hypothetical protein